jgi:hypothetical protein
MKTTKKKVQSLPALMKKAQAAFNTFIRERDKGKPCVSCGSFNTAHASHFYAAGSYTGLRFTEDNCHASCVSCNTYKHGNVHEYRRGIVERIGKQNLDLLDAASVKARFKKYSRFELEWIIEEYKNRVKQLKKAA